MSQNQKLLNKCVTIQVQGKGQKGDFFGKIDNIICFIKVKEGQNVNFDDFVDVRITNVSEKCVFAELI